MKNSKKLTIRKISDKSAKNEIGELFIRKLSEGIKKVDVSEVSTDLKIPGDQVEKIFLQFIKDGSVKKV